jgi:hypothetical protein
LANRPHNAPPTVALPSLEVPPHRAPGPQVLNEFVAYQELGGEVGKALSPRALVIATYALCGSAPRPAPAAAPPQRMGSHRVLREKQTALVRSFSNFASVGIQAHAPCPPLEAS